MSHLTSVEGRAWVFGNDVNTDVIMPGPEVLVGRAGEAARWCLHAVRPGWAGLVCPGDILIAGRNFGCGSGRLAPRVLREVGIGAVVAESVARTFFRNAVSLGLPVLSCPTVVDMVSDNDMCAVDVAGGWVRNLTRGTAVRGRPLPVDSPPWQILNAGGIEAFMRRMLAQSATARAATFGLSVNHEGEITCDTKRKDCD